MKIIQQALTFDDVLLIPRYSEVLPRNVDVSTNVSVHLPFLSAAMDTVTESRLAIAMAQMGAIGIVHKNMSPQQQANEIRKVKRFEAGLVRDPITVTSDLLVRDVRGLIERFGISGFPVVDSGQLVGILANRDLRFAAADQTVRSITTPRDRLVTVKEADARDKAGSLMNAHKLERVLVVSESFELCGLVTEKDLSRSKEFPNATKDGEGKLRVGAAVWG